MARPSLKAEKTEVILQAYEQCVARYGVEGATLQRVADTADMARPLLRHYIGNQQDLLKQCSQRYVTRSLAEIQSLTDIQSMDELLTVLFMEGNQTDVAISSALVLASSEYPLLQTAMTDWFSDYQALFEQILAKLLPNDSAEQIEQKTLGLLGVYFNYHTLHHLAHNKTANKADKSFKKKSLQSAQMILNT